MPRNARRLVQANARALWDADFVVTPRCVMAATPASTPPATRSLIRNSSLRELVALAYGVESCQVTGGATGST